MPPLDHHAPHDSLDALELGPATRREPAPAAIDEIEEHPGKEDTVVTVRTHLPPDRPGLALRRRVAPLSPMVRRQASDVPFDAHRAWFRTGEKVRRRASPRGGGARKRALPTG